MCTPNAVALAISSIVLARSVGEYAALPLAISIVPGEGRAFLQWRNTEGAVTIGNLKAQLCSMLAPLAMQSDALQWRTSATSTFLQRALELAKQIVELTGPLPLLTVDESIDLILKDGREAAQTYINDNRATIYSIAEALTTSGELTQADVARLLNAA